MIADNREWRRVGGATPQALERLRAASPVQLPETYLALLEFSNGGEGPLPIQPLYFLLYSAEEAAETLGGGDKNYFPGFVVIGSNGGGEFIALDTREVAPWPVVALDMTNADLDESVMPVAADFSSFVEIIGLES